MPESGAVKINLPRIGRFKAGNKPEKRSLSAAAGPYYGGKTPGRYNKVNIPYRPHLLPVIQKGTAEASDAYLAVLRQLNH
jgi:hypothetical protein